MARAGIRPRARTFRNRNFLFEFRLANERQTGLRIVGTKSATAHSILLETTAYFTAPFRFWFRFGFLMNRASCDRLRNHAVLGCKRAVTEGAPIGVFEQQSTTLRTYLYHWSVLRCGSSSEERRNVNTIAFAQTIAVVGSDKCRLSGNPHWDAYFSTVRASIRGYFALFRFQYPEANFLPPDCDHSGRV